MFEASSRLLVGNLDSCVVLAWTSFAVKVRHAIRILGLSLCQLASMTNDTGVYHSAPDSQSVQTLATRPHRQP